MCVSNTTYGIFLKFPLKITKRKKKIYDNYSKGSSNFFWPQLQVGKVTEKQEPILALTSKSTVKKGQFEINYWPYFLSNL